MVELSTPLEDNAVLKLRAGDRVFLSGIIYTARDAAHKRLVEDIARGKSPIPLKGQVIYYSGPTPAPPGYPIGAAGPTTSSRMDPYTVPLLEAGLKGMIGKGFRTKPVREAIKKFRAIYFATIGGAGAYLAKRVKSAEVVAYEDLGPEAIYKLEVEKFPLIVINDAFGHDFYKQKEG